MGGVPGTYKGLKSLWLLLADNRGILSMGKATTPK